MKLLKPFWFDQVQFSGGYNSPNNRPPINGQGEVEWEEGNDGVSGRVLVHNARGYRYTVSADVWADDPASVPQVIGRVNRLSGHTGGTSGRLIGGGGNNHRLSRHGCWERLVCSVVANHPDGNFVEMVIGQSGTGSFKFRNFCVDMEPVVGQYGEGKRGLHVGDDEHGCVMLPDGTVEYWETVDIDISESFIHHLVPFEMVRWVSGSEGVCVWSVAYEEDVVTDAEHIGQIYTRFRVVGTNQNQTGQITFQNGNPKSSSRIIPFRILVRGQGVRVGY